MWNTQITKTLSLRKRHHLGGGQERIDKQHAKGKMTALERIHYLLDPWQACLRGVRRFHRHRRHFG